MLLNCMSDLLVGNLAPGQKKIEKKHVVKLNYLCLEMFDSFTSLHEELS